MWPNASRTAAECSVAPCVICAQTQYDLLHVMHAQIFGLAIKAKVETTNRSELAAAAAVARRTAPISVHASISIWAFVVFVRAAARR